MTFASPVRSGGRFRRSAAFAAVATLLVVLLGATFAQSGDLDQQVFEIARQLRCPVCVSESVADSSSRVAIEMREVIQQQLEEGRTEAEVLAFFQDRYGDWILQEPPRRGIHLLVWLLPVIVAVIGAGTLAWFVRRWVASGEEVPDVAEEDLARVREAMAERDQPRPEGTS